MNTLLEEYRSRRAMLEEDITLPREQGREVATFNRGITAVLRMMKQGILDLLIITIFFFPIGSSYAYSHDADTTTTMSSIKSGVWSDPMVWSTNKVPGTNDDVKIKKNHTIYYETVSTKNIHSIIVRGHLRFAKNKDTLLNVGMLIITDDESIEPDNACSGRSGRATDSIITMNPASLEVGLPNDPIRRAVTAQIRLMYFEDQDSNCAPAIINHGAKMNFHGAPLKKTWVKLGATAKKNATSLTLSETVHWSPGSKIIITGLGDYFRNIKIDIASKLPDGHPDAIPHIGENTIKSISKDGKTITLAKPLDGTYLGSQSERDKRGEVALLSRNVIIESRDPLGVRGHTMYHRGSKGAISYTEFRNLGKAGTLGRYPIHFHLAKNSMRGSYVKGASIWNSYNRWIVIHGTEYMVIKDVIGYKSVGNGFYLEDSTEVYNLLDHVLGAQAQATSKLPGQVLDFDDNAGACFWAGNARNFVTGSVFSRCGGSGVSQRRGAGVYIEYRRDNARNGIDTFEFVLQPDGSRKRVAVNRLSGGKISNVEVHSSAHANYGVILFGGTFPVDEPFLFEEIRIWNIWYSMRLEAENIILDGAEIQESAYSIYKARLNNAIIRNVFIRKSGSQARAYGVVGGGGTVIFEHSSVTENHVPTFSVAAREKGASANPIQIHARDYTISTIPKLVDGRGARVKPLTVLYLHGLFGPGRDAVVLPSVQSEDQPGLPRGLTFVPGSLVDRSTLFNVETRRDPFRDDVKVAEANIPWPNHQLYDPVDKLPPATVILSPQAGELIEGITLTVKGTVVDQYEVVSVTVNGIPAAIQPNGIDWVVSLTNLAKGLLTITASATDDSENTELTPHSISVMIE